jgi:site-specific DNA recombinase
MRAVIYPRVSSQAQKDRHTIASQLSTLPAFVASQAWTLVRPADYYIDDGRTAKAGHLAERESFTRLLRDASRGEFDVVAVVDLDRLTRSEDLQERGEVLGAFQRAGVRIAVSSTGQVLDLRSSMGDLMSTLGAFFAAEENRKRRDRCVRGKHEAIRKGKKPSGPTPFGYLYDATVGTWSIDPDLGPIVVEVFKRIAAGETCHALAMEFQARGVPRARPSKTNMRKAGYWCRERVYQIVRARTYLGEWTADKAKRLTVAIPPIVTEDLFEAADEALKRSGRRGQSRVRHSYLAQGIAKCALCSGPIGCASTNGGTVNKRRIFYYVCSERRRPRGQRCTLPMRRVDEVDEQLWRAFSELLMRPDLVDRALAARDEEATSGVRDWGKDLRDYQRKLARLNEAEAAILERFSHGLIAPEVMDRHLKKSARERQMLEKQVEVAREQTMVAQAEQHEMAALRATAETLRGRLATATAEERREIVWTLVPGRDDHWIVIGPKEVAAKVLLAAQAEQTSAFAKVDRAGL